MTAEVDYRAIVNPPPGTIMLCRLPTLEWEVCAVNIYGNWHRKTVANKAAAWQLAIEFGLRPS